MVYNQVEDQSVPNKMQVIGVGIATIDVIQEVEAYPNGNQVLGIKKRDSGV